MDLYDEKTYAGEVIELMYSIYKIFDHMSQNLLILMNIMWMLMQNFLF